MKRLYLIVLLLMASLEGKTQEKPPAFIQQNVAISFDWRFNAMPYQKDEAFTDGSLLKSYKQYAIGPAFTIGRHAYVAAMYGYRSGTKKSNTIVGVASYESHRLEFMGRIQSVISRDYGEFSTFETQLVCYAFKVPIGIGAGADSYTGIGPHLQVRYRGFCPYVGYHYGFWSLLQDRYTLVTGVNLLFRMQKGHIKISPFVPETRKFN